MLFITSNKSKLHPLQNEEHTEFSECLPSFGPESFVFCLVSTNIQIEVQRNRILPVVLYRCETWSLKLRDEHKLGVLENRVLRKIIGPKEEGATGEWRKLHYEHLHHLFCSPYIIHVIKTKRMRWVGHVACMGAGTAAYRVLLQKPEGKRSLGWPRHRQNDNTKMDLREMSLLCAVRSVNNFTKTHVHAFVYSPNALYIRKCRNVSIFRWTVHVTQYLPCCVP